MYFNKKLNMILKNRDERKRLEEVRKKEKERTKIVNQQIEVILRKQEEERKQKKLRDDIALLFSTRFY